jgi:predicted acetyltransferase
MIETRMLHTDDFDALARIFADAYPGLKIVSDEDRACIKERILKVHEEEPTVSFHGLFRDGQLLGIMAFHDFSMNFLGARILVGGVGQVAVHLAHKKEHVAKEMMLYFLRHYRQRGAPLVALYPFRPDFYRKMGFGYGTKTNEYRIKPSALPTGLKSHVRYLDKDDQQAIVDCYHRFVDRTHGMMAKTERRANRLFETAANRIVGYEADGEIQGYLVFTFDQGDDFITNDIHVEEFIYESREALSELLTFLHTQDDQIRHVYIRTQDQDFHHLLRDPRLDGGRLIPEVWHETNAQGIGLMYRVVDVPRMFDLLGGHDFGGQTCTLKLTVEDSFLPESAGSTLLRFTNGRVQRSGGRAYDVEVSLDIADLTSVLAGTVSFQSLHRYGLAQLSDASYVDTVGRLFAVEQKPMCTTSF